MILMLFLYCCSCTIIHCLFSIKKITFQSFFLRLCFTCFREKKVDWSHTNPNTRKKKNEVQLKRWCPYHKDENLTVLMAVGSCDTCNQISTYYNNSKCNNKNNVNSTFISCTIFTKLRAGCFRSPLL